MDELQEQLETCTKDLYFMIKQNDFWVQFSEHMVIAISFMLLGIITSIGIFVRLHKNKIRYDYSLRKGAIMRVPNNDGDITFVVRPSSYMGILDLLFLCIYDRKKDELISEHDRKRVRIITVSFLILFVILFLSGFLLIFSASVFSTNPLDYM